MNQAQRTTDTFSMDDLTCPRCDSTHLAMECVREGGEWAHRMACYFCGHRWEPQEDADRGSSEKGVRTSR
jgi:transcription elongation factor Elf1